ncbi:SufE family protein [Sulfurimonas sp.]|nr:SufE family protein [Sulfurimonas sp.]
MIIRERIKEISNNLSLFDDVMQKYEYIIELGHELPSLDNKYKTDAYRVKGCQSNVWLNAYEKEDKLFFEADSDALIVRGLVNILISIYSSNSVGEILNSPSTLLEELGLNEIITAGRQNGVNSMLKRIYQFAHSKKGGINV